MIPRARLQEVTEADIQGLIDHGVPEGRTLDYKRDWPRDQDARFEIAKDVCAFANALGGDLIFGVGESSEGGHSLAPLRLADVDKELLAIVNSMRDLLEPRVSGGLLAHPVLLQTGGYVVVLRVTPSPSAPHRVTRDRHFYMRTSVGKEQMDIQGIRNAFAASASLAQQAKNFRDGALQQIDRRAGPVPDLARPACVVHLVPISGVTRPTLYDVDTLRRAAEKLRTASPGGLALDPARVNFEGSLCTTIRNQDFAYLGYGQVYRDGCIELVDASSLQVAHGDFDVERYAMYPDRYEVPLVRSGLRAMIDALTELEISGPAYLMTSWVVDAGTCVAVTLNDRLRFLQLPRHLTEIVNPPIYLENFDVDAATTLRPAFDVLWNAVGIPHTQTSF
ncbi:MULTISPECIES: ATP-binding protein [unclassified Burkholderia]|uniref:AlbA family DNA-binding domain-containing protein n=1 Tax=unclassified Burkholderia TaxID=2613784 RepID=UPI001421F247|nr:MULTISPECIES: ATP-binding protein [unclassified Burkholderia]